jgi:DNA-binding winged helix-turn-helix (wHTH) protein
MATARSILSYTPTLAGLPNRSRPVYLPERRAPNRPDLWLVNSERSALAPNSGFINQPAEPSIGFGPFRVYPRRRLLLDGDAPLRVGSRALDILIFLLERPGELLTKRELIARVWPDLTVEDANLKVHVAALRRTLRDGQNGNRFICTVPGRGYSFVAPVVCSGGAPDVPPDPWRDGLGAATPGRDLLRMIAAQLSQERFTTVIGAGDMVKGVFLAAALIADYRHGVHFVDLAVLSDPLLLPAAVSAAVGLEVGSRDPSAYLTAYLADKNLLLVLDNCRHIIGETAAFAAGILKDTRDVKILAISG